MENMTVNHETHSGAIAEPEHSLDLDLNRPWTHVIDALIIRSWVAGTQDSRRLISMLDLIPFVEKLSRSGDTQKS